MVRIVYIPMKMEGYERKSFIYKQIGVMSRYKNINLITMKNFSEYEQRLIENLVKTDLLKSNVLDFISNTVLVDRGIEIKEDAKIISLLYSKTDKNALTEFFECISTIDYLEKNNLIFVHSNYDLPQKGNFVSKNITQEILDSKVTDFFIQPIPTNIFDLIMRYKISYFYVRSELKKILENNFKTYEQMYHEEELTESKKQTRISRFSFYLALGALLFSFIAPFIFDANINQDQVNEINQNLKVLELSVKDIKTEILLMRETLIDTLNSSSGKETQRPTSNHTP